MKKRVCSAAGCNRLTEIFEHEYCAAHAHMKGHQFKGAGRKSMPLKYGADWHKIRGSFIKHNPICNDCGGQATEAHHIKAYRDGGANTADNLMALCKSCHAGRTLSEHNSKGYIPRVTVDANGIVHRKDETGEAYSPMKSKSNQQKNRDNR